MNGSVESSQIGPGWQFVTKTNSSGHIEVSRFQDDVAEPFFISDSVGVPAGNYTAYGVEAAYDFKRGNPYSIGTYITAGTFYDGKRFSCTLRPLAYISAHLQLEGMYQLNRIEFPERNKSFTGHIGRLKIEAYLNVKHSLVSFIQYNSANHSIITNLRYRFNPSEGHDLYIVYDEGLNYDLTREVPILPLTNNRTILLKYSYTFNIEL
jgi:hypothetical protein